MKCTKCGTDINEDVRFCSKCGNPVLSSNDKVNCIKCDRKIGGDLEYCPYCGESNSSRGRRNQRDNDDDDEDDEGGILGGITDFIGKLFGG